ncbi:MAG: SurA N-terminal domain-containing protein [Actinomycetota bacterium]
MKPIRVAVLLVAVAGVVLALGYAGHERNGRDSDRVIARVDGVEIRQSQATSRFEGIRQTHGATLELNAEWRAKVLRTLIEDVVTERAAAEMGIAPESKDILKHLDEFKGRFSSGAEYERWLKDAGLDEQELLRRMRLQTLTALVYEEVTDDVRVTDDAIEKYYSSHLDDFPGEDGSRPLLEVRSSIEEILLKQAKDDEFEAWLDLRRGAARVTILDLAWKEES